MSSYYSDDEELDVRVRRFRAPSPARRPAPRSPPHAPHYIQTISRDRHEQRPYYQAGPVLLEPGRTMVSTRSRSRERRSSPPSQASTPAPVAPVVIHNKIYNEQSDDDSDDSRYHRSRPRRSHSRRPGRSSSRYSRASSSDSNHSAAAREKYELEVARRQLAELQVARTGQAKEAEAREKWELEQARRQLEELKHSTSREREDSRLHRQYREEAELQRAKQELDEIKRKEAREKEEKQIRKDYERRRLEEEKKEEEEKDAREAAEKRIRKEIELKRLEEEKKAREEAERIKKEKEAAVAEWKAAEAARELKEKEEKEAADKEYQRRLQEDLLRSGLSEKEIEAILKKEKIKRDDANRKKEEAHQHEQQIARPTYTRMNLRHLDIDTLIYYKIDWEYDQEPGYILIKRWVPEWEQDLLWKHTREIRLVRERESKDARVVVKLEDHHKKHKHRSKTEDDQFMWVHKKTERRRSKSPGLLMYLAGGRPSN